MLERYIAIDNVCAWPCLTLLPDGVVIATLFNQPTHGGSEGETECWASEDEGRSWTRRGVVAPRTPGRNNGLNHAAGLAPDGALLVITSGRDNRPPPGSVRSTAQSRSLPPLFARSCDDGRTWEVASAGASGLDPEEIAVAFGPIHPLGEDLIGTTVHREGDTFFYRSTDHGRTWDAPSLIARRDYNETCFCVVDSRQLLAAARTYGDQHLDLYHSGDRGETWTFRGPVTLAGQVPGHLLKLSDGRILLTYGIRNPGLRGLGYRVSHDEGMSWSRPGLLLNFGLCTDGGYPSTVQLGDGTLVTAYYAGAVPAHMRYHMGIVRWSIEDLKEASPFQNSFAAGAAWRSQWGSCSSTEPGEI